MPASRSPILQPPQRMSALLRAAGLLFLVSASSCTTTVASPPPVVTPYSAGIKKVVVEIDYAEGAVPYTGSARFVRKQIPDIWDIARKNLQRLAPGRTVTIPSNLSEMEVLSDVRGSTFTSEQIQEIAAKHRTQKTSGDTVSYYVLYLNGRLKDDTNTVRDEVLGVSIGDTGVIAVFKPVITSSAPASRDALLKFMEQSTLTHELGHAVGFVNRHVPMVSPHQDTAHGSHCTSDKCVMYYQNEGPSAAIAFASRLSEEDGEIMFGAECLADADQAAGQ
jgi:hypothetical protein